MKRRSLCSSCFLCVLCVPPLPYSKHEEHDEPRRVQSSYIQTFLLLLAFILTTSSYAQITDSSFTLIKTYKGDITNAAVDNLDNLYIISSTGQVKKFGPKGDSIGVFNGIRNYGKLTAIDVTNPLKPLLFYKDFSNVVVLDRFLANRISLNLRKFNILQPSAIGLSYDNNIWVFDQYDNKLKKIDESGNLLSQTDDFRSLFSQSFAPQKIINDDGFVYLADSTSGIFVFDNYGTYKRKILLKNWNAIDISSGRVVRLSKEAIVVYNPVNFSEKSLPYPSSFKPYLHSFTTSNKMVTFSQDSLRVYRVGY